jgi:hypothetical protein
MNRRAFLGGLVATATMAEAGALAEFMDWLRRKPMTTVGKDLFVPIRPTAWTADYILAGDHLLEVNDIVEFNGHKWRINATSHGGVIGRCSGFEWEEEKDVSSFVP